MKNSQLSCADRSLRSKKWLFFVMFMLFCASPFSLSTGDVSISYAIQVPQKTPTLPGSSGGDTITTVICNAIGYVKSIGLPIMTLVVVGSCFLAIFGRLPWAAIVTLVVFSAVFFGADQVVTRFGDGITTDGTTHLAGCTK